MTCFSFSSSLAHTKWTVKSIYDNCSTSFSNSEAGLRTKVAHNHLKVLQILNLIGICNCLQYLLHANNPLKYEKVLQSSFAGMNQSTLNAPNSQRCQQLFTFVSHHCISSEWESLTVNPKIPTKHQYGKKPQPF